jgi:hypothetical protein
MAKMHSIKGSNGDNGIFKRWKLLKISMYLHGGQK